MIFQLTSVLVGMFFLQSAVVDAKTDEVLQMKVFNHNFRFSDSEMHAMLNKANLTGHGFKKEITTKVVQEADENRQEYQKAYFFYKVVNCTQIKEVDEELDNLLPGLSGKDVDDKFKKEVKFRHLDNMGTCRVGVEIHFKEAEGCYADQKVSQRRKKRRSPCWWCDYCRSVQAM